MSIVDRMTAASAVACAAYAVAIHARMGEANKTIHRLPVFSPRRLAFVILLAFSFRLGPSCPLARADPSIEISGAAGFGALVAGVTTGRFTVSPSASFSVRGEYGFFVLRDTVSFLGLAGGRFGLDNETTLGGGIFWKNVNVSAGLSLAEISLPICGPRFCGQVRGLVPGADVRLDVFGPFLSDALGLSVDCGATWITGRAAPVWSGVSVRCTAGPIVRFSFQP